MNIIKLVSEAERGKPETEVLGECDGLFDRDPGTLVHYKDNAKELYCEMCGEDGFLVWVSSVDAHEAHPARCTLITGANNGG